MFVIKAIRHDRQTDIYEATQISITSDRDGVILENSQNNSSTTLRVGNNEYHARIFIENQAGRTIESLYPSKDQ